MAAVPVRLNEPRESAQSRVPQAAGLRVLSDAVLRITPMNIVERVKNICLTPTTEWPIIAAEQTSAGSLISGYVAPLVAIGAVAGFVGGSLIGRTLPFIGT
jgi:hypothetical protein